MSLLLAAGWTVAMLLTVGWRVALAFALAISLVYAIDCLIASMSPHGETGS